GAVVEGADVQLVDDGVPVPERVVVQGRRSAHQASPSCYRAGRGGTVTVVTGSGSGEFPGTHRTSARFWFGARSGASLLTRSRGFTPRDRLDDPKRGAERATSRIKRSAGTLRLYRVHRPQRLMPRTVPNAKRVGDGAHAADSRSFINPPPLSRLFIDPPP